MKVTVQIKVEREGGPTATPTQEIPCERDIAVQDVDPLARELLATAVHAVEHKLKG